MLPVYAINLGYQSRLLISANYGNDHLESEADVDVAGVRRWLRLLKGELTVGVECERELLPLLLRAHLR